MITEKKTSKNQILQKKFPFIYENLIDIFKYSGIAGIGILALGTTFRLTYKLGGKIIDTRPFIHIIFQEGRIMTKKGNIPENSKNTKDIK